ncbi:hypothetical protein Q8W15_15775 [Photobacterium damselae subsp. piscicida]|nr:hypothetical protein [Photobacterium damselae subsp. piscicida]MDP2558355.1 hypothetical protein [Photobacterium damselae subsp. piscicida]
MMRSSFFVEGGEFCFDKSGFTAHFHPEFIDTLCWLSRFSQVSKQTFDGYWLSLRNFLSYIRDINHPLFEHLHLNSPLDDFGSFELWQSALISFREHVDCINNLGDVPTIEWYKRRAKSTLFKAICSKLRVSSFDVVRHLKRATKPYRMMPLYPEDENMLFLSFHSSSYKKNKAGEQLPRKPNNATFTAKTKATIAEISNGNWVATADMVRKSVLLLSAMNGG